jgi:hypothetical protein
MRSAPTYGRLLSDIIMLVIVSSGVARAQDTLRVRGTSEDASSTGITGTVTATQTGEPVMGVQVLVKGTRRWAVTDQDGSFQLERLQPGSTTVEFRHSGRAPLNYELTLEPNQVVDLAVKIDTRTVALPKIVVQAEESRAATKLGQFYDRAKRGHGYFITRKDIDDRQPRVLSDMLRRVPGLRVDCSAGGCVVTSFEQTQNMSGGCPLQLFLDGAPYSGEIDQLTPAQVEGIEVYRSSSSAIPPQFNTGNSMCGVIAIWSRVPGG